MADLLRSLVVVGVIVAALVAVNYRAPEDPVKQIDPAPVARQIAAVAPFPVLLPQDQGWRATAARWEPTQESGSVPVWYTGGVYGANGEGPFAALSQSTATSQDFVAEQTSGGAPTGVVIEVGATPWSRYASMDTRSLVRVNQTGATIVAGTGSWEDLERFAASLVPAAEQP